MPEPPLFIKIKTPPPLLFWEGAYAASLYSKYPCPPSYMFICHGIGDRNCLENERKDMLKNDFLKIIVNLH